MNSVRFANHDVWICMMKTSSNSSSKSKYAIRLNCLVIRMLLLCTILAMVVNTWILWRYDHHHQQQQQQQNDALVTNNNEDSSPGHRRASSWRFAPERLLPMNETYSSNETVQQPLHSPVNDTLQQQRQQQIPYAYWNLSCPLEMSSFSAIHMGFEERAEQARQVALQAIPMIQQWLQEESLQTTNKHRRILFVGDSLLRQVFISLGCHLLAHSSLSFSSASVEHSTEMAVAWYMNRQARTHQPNSKATGIHSKFEEARVVHTFTKTKRTAIKTSDNYNPKQQQQRPKRTQTQTATLELIFHHNLGGLLTLGDEYQQAQAKDHAWIEACYRQEPFRATVLSLNHSSDNNSSITDETNISYQDIELSPDDVIVLNGSVHGNRHGNLLNIVSLLQCMQHSRHVKKTKSIGTSRSWPRTIVYMATSLEHFPTESNVWEELLYMETYDCRQEAIRWDRQQEELELLQKESSLGLLGNKRGNASTSRLNRRNNVTANTTLIPFVGDELWDLQSKSGHFHVGNRDCLHWIMPGIPDLLASSLVRYLQRVGN